ncbi:hypothetical protein HRbin06_00453 [archaeon HR06]|nr:hypothetical protein HRbin06_00453 [archaeon HR06]
MSWICYKFLLKAKSPIHVGYGVKLGIVDRTRYYIPARNVWGALTNLITKSIMKSYKPRLYQEIGKSLNENVKLSYFYVYDGRQVFAPFYGGRGLEFGISKDQKRISAEEFEYNYIGSFASTAIDKSSKSAEEGTLHEIEYIKPVPFIGYLFTRHESLELIRGVETSFEDFIVVNGTILTELWVGGERNYGFGRTEISLEKLSEKEIHLFNSETIVNLTEKEPLIESEDSTKIALAHTDFRNLSTELIRGDLEPFSGREWGEGGAGQRIREDTRVYIAPGSIFKLKEMMKIRIGDLGIWEAF